jgi:hypothetical protein
VGLNLGHRYKAVASTFDESVPTRESRPGASSAAPCSNCSVDDFATRSTFQSHSLEHRKDQFDRGTREFVERTLGDVIPAMGYA